MNENHDYEITFGNSTTSEPEVPLNLYDYLQTEDSVLVKKITNVVQEVCSEIKVISDGIIEIPKEDFLHVVSGINAIVATRDDMEEHYDRDIDYREYEDEGHDLSYINVEEELGDVFTCNRDDFFANEIYTATWLKDRGLYTNIIEFPTKDEMHVRAVLDSLYEVYSKN